MGTQRTTFAKMQREKAKKAKQAAKREKRQQRSAAAAESAESGEVEPQPTLPKKSAAELMDQMAALHDKFEDGQIDFEDFEDAKAELVEQLALTAD